MSLAILGLFSFGWIEELVPDGSEAIGREECPAVAAGTAADTVAEAAPPAIREAAAPKPRGGDPSPSTVMRPSHSVCIGICAGGDVWAVACGA